ncbi:MAG TPA: sensor domain-containing diguanylate cyclase, partial [Devosia sp.]|nr:sensor domain-containing diguanylate cyclase [Devosia sp.]
RLGGGLVTRLRISISGILKGTTAILAVLTIIIAVAASLVLTGIDRQTEAIGNIWFQSSGLLKEMADQLSEFRVAEGYRALAQTGPERAAAEDLASEHRRSIADLESQYVSLMAGVDGAPSLVPFRLRWEQYQRAHDAWVASDTDGSRDSEAANASGLHELYVATDEGLDAIDESSQAAVKALHESVDVTVDRSATAMALAALAAAIAGALAFVGINRMVARPMAAITSALTRLARGERDVRVPELRREDEIGRLAQALEVFRANAAALERAHEETRAAQERADSLARHDALTGLPNRRVFAVELANALHSVGDGVAFSVMILDLDRFKPVNDLMGHAVGDLVLCEVADRLSDSLDKGSMVARLGGDEFAIVCQDGTGNGADAAIRTANKLLSAVRVPIRVGDSRVEVGASIGIAMAPRDGTDPNR